MTSLPFTLDTLDTFEGRELGVSDWLVVDQDRIDRFAACTGDHQWIHVDPERARRESPFGTTVAHGFLTLSLLPLLRQTIPFVPEGVTQALNYGLDRVRFLHPVPAGARIRDRVTLLRAERKKSGIVLVTLRHSVEVEGAAKPAMVAETLTLLIA